MSEPENVDFDFINVKVKVEKETPPRNVEENDTNNEDSSHSEETENNEEQNDVKKPIEPIKSSNEILAELFKVFNAAPPPSLLDDDFLLKKSKKRKKDKKHHKKKSKKRGRSSSDEKQSERSEDEDKAKKKHKKHKKHKKSKKCDSGEEKEKEKDKDKTKDKLSKIEIKKEKIDVEPRKDIAFLKKQSDESDFVISDEEGEITNDKEPIVLRTLDNHNSPNEKVVKREEEKKSASTSHSVSGSRSGICSSVARRIIIKSLKNSEVLKEVEKQKVQKENDREKRSGNRGPDDSSELSLSDEETYLKERSESYYRRRELSGRKRRLSRSRYKDSSRDRFKRHKWRGSRSRSRSLHRRRSRSRSRRTDDLIIDKKRLLEIARKNAISMFKSGSLPGTQSMTQETKDKVLMKMRYGGKSVEELTEFCKKLSKGGSLNDLSSVSSNEDSDHDKDGNEKAFHHPFVLKDRGPIVMNIKNATPIPPKTAEQTKAILMQYPVSSGQQHRLNESEWIPVSPKRNEPTVPVKAQPPKNVFEKPIPTEKQRPAFKPTQATQTSVPTEATPPDIVPPAPVVNTVAHTPAHIPPPIPVAPAVPPAVPMQLMPPVPEHVPMIPAAAPLPRMPPQAPVQTNLLQSVSPTAPLITMPTNHPSHISAGNIHESVFPSQNSNIDVASIITKRLNAMRKLQDNPTDPEALKMMYNSQKDMSAWVSSKFTPGQFTGSTGANVLSARELNAGHQAWVKRDQLTSTLPVSGGMGMHLLQKMGWRPGEGLGKEKNGSLQPLLLEVKLDKRGLVTTEEDPSLRGRRRRPPVVKQQQMPSIENKHPVSLLGELSAKRKWGAPAYELVEEHGPAHHRNFIFKVILNNVMYQPAIPCNSKKEAKALAAKYCLQQLGILPP